MWSIPLWLLYVHVVAASVRWEHFNNRPLYKERTHSREAAGLAALALGNVLLQIADVSASSTSCCQWLRQNIPNKTTGWGMAAVMRGTLYRCTHLTHSRSVIVTPVSSSGWLTEQSVFKGCLFKHMTAHFMSLFGCMVTSNTAETHLYQVY